MLRKILLLVLAVSVLVSAFAGCAKKGNENEKEDSSSVQEGTTQQKTETSQQSDTPQQQTEEPREKLDPNAVIRIWFSLYPEENKMLQEIGDKFKEETGVKIEVIDSNFFEIRQKYPIAANASDAPDLILAQAADLGTLVEADTLRPIEFVDQSFENRFASIAFDSFKYDGKLYGIGYSADAYGIVYNKNLISEVPKTWSEFFKKAEELTIKNEKGEITQYGFLINPTNYWFAYPMIARHGGYYFGKNPDGSFNPSDIGLANEGSVKAFNELLELKEKGMTVQSSEDDESIISQRFSEGKVAMMIYALWSAQAYKDAGIDYGYAPLPNNDDGTPSRPLGSVLGIVANKNTRYVKEADAFLQYMMRDENLQKLYEAANGGEAKNGQRNTLNKSVYNSEYVQSDANLKALADVSMECEVFPSNPEATVIWNYAKQAFDNIFYNGKPVEEALAELESVVKEDMAKMKN